MLKVRYSQIGEIHKMHLHKSVSEYLSIESHSKPWRLGVSCL